MSVDILETRIHHTEEILKGTADQVKTLVEKLQDNEKSIYKLSVMQELNEEKLNSIEHRLKNNEVVMKSFDDEQQKIKTHLIESAAHNNAKKTLFKNSNTLLVLLFTIINGIAIVYDRIAEHLARAVS